MVLINYSHAILDQEIQNNGGCPEAAQRKIPASQKISEISSSILVRELIVRPHNENAGFIIFEVKLTFELLTVHGQQHSFSTHERMFLWKCQSFWDRKCLDLRGTRTPKFRIYAECSNHLSYQGQTFAVPCFEHWLWRYRYFWSKVNIWTVNCARATAFIFDTQTDVLVKVSRYLQKLHFLDTWCLTEQTNVLRSNTTSNRTNHTACQIWPTMLHISCALINSLTLKTSSISTNLWGPELLKTFKKHYIYNWVFRLIFHSWFIWCPLHIARAFEHTTHMTISSTFNFTNTLPYAWKYDRIDSTELIQKRGFDWQHTTEHLSSIL